MFEDPAQLHRALSDSTRLRLVALLDGEGELCVCELVHALDMIQPRISRHLALLRDQGVLRTRRSGQWVLYRLNEELPEWARQVIALTAAAMRETEEGKADRARLSGMQERPSQYCCA
ncbi:MAG: ArsR family transcriptional regulator [Gammaproteobacteria bacterium]|nr:MAG: ArsR family transcriptional regulator [Gammaproteobacteria bacterium]